MTPQDYNLLTLGFLQIVAQRHINWAVDGVRSASDPKEIGFLQFRYCMNRKLIHVKVRLLVLAGAFRWMTSSFSLEEVKEN